MDWLFAQFFDTSLLERALQISTDFSIHALFKLQVFLFAILTVMVFLKSGFHLSNLHLNPAALLSLSFLLLITFGTIVLSLPRMTTGQNISVLDALFTSTSASCVTGLIVQDTANFFTLRGQLAIMILIQLGGLNMVIVATFISSIYSGRGSLSSARILSSMLDTDYTDNLKIIIRKVVLYSAIIELAGVIAIFFSWGQYPFNSLGEKIYFSIFHAISAFNNAGFSLFSHGLNETALQHQYTLHLVIAFLIILGGLGFLVLQDVFSFDRLRKKENRKWQKLQPHSRLILRISGALLLIAGVAFYFLENTNSLVGHSLTGKIITSFFQAVTLRTAGFNTVDIGSLTTPTLLLFLFFMFVGASPGSTGGGIKTSTFFIAIQAAVANIRGKENVEIYHRTISWEAVNKTYAIIIISLSLLFGFTFLLTIAEPQFSLKEIIFETFSAFGTVGLSTGITEQLSDAGKIIITILMYIGRLGSLTIGIALSRKIKYKNYKYPTAHFIVG
jgi:potassium uptake TrkH family protein